MLKYNQSHVNRLCGCIYCRCEGRRRLLLSVSATWSVVAQPSVQLLMQTHCVFYRYTIGLQGIDPKQKDVGDVFCL